MPSKGKETKQSTANSPLSLSADLKDYFDLLQERVVVTDLCSNLIFVNKAAQLDLGKDRNSINPLEWHEYYHVRDAQTLTPLPPEKLPIAQVLATGKECKIDLCLAFNQKDAYIKVHARPKLDTQGKMEGAVVTYSDATQEFEHKRKMLEKETQLNTLLERINEGVIHLDLSGNILFANQNICRMLGLKQRQILSRNITEIITFTKDSPLKARKLLENGSKDISGRYELSVLDANRQERIFEVSAAPMKNELGKVTGILNLHTDITERRQASDKLRQSEASYRSLLEQMSEGVVLLSTDGTITFANERFYKITGYTAGELVGSSYAERFQVSQLTPKKGELELPIKNKKGEVRWLRISFTQYKASKTLAARTMLIHSDITAEKKFAEERERLLITAESTTDFVAMVRIDGTVLYVNKAGRKAVGIPLTKAAEKLTMADYYTPESLNKLMTEAIPQAIKNGSWQGEVAAIGKDGGVIPISQVIIAKRNAQKQVEYFASIGRDISELKKMHREMAILARMPHEQPSPLMRLAHNGTITYANPASEIILEKWKTAIGKKVPSTWQKIVTNILRQGHYKEFEITCGKIIFELKLVPVPEYDYVNLIGIDITHRKNAEEQLINSERKYRAVVEDQTELISRYLANGTITFVNSAYCRYFGHNPTEIIGKNLYDYIPKNMFGVFKKRLATLTKENPSITYSQEIPSKTQASRWQMWTDRAIYDDKGKFIEYQSVAQDITALKETEQELRVQELYLRQIIDSIPNLVFVRDANGAYKLVNKAFANLVGKEIKEIIGNKHQNVASHFPLGKRFLLQDKQVITTNQEQVFEEERITRPTDGAEYWFSTIKKPLAAPDGKTQVLGVSTDITQRKLVEESLQLQLLLKEMISNIATRFINLPYHQIDDAIQKSLKTLGEINNVDRVVINLKNGHNFKPRHYWLKENTPENKAVMKMAHPFNTDTWEATQILEHGYLYIQNTGEIPENSYLKEFVEKASIKSSIILPLQSRGKIIGIMTLTSTQKQLTWKEDIIALLRITSQVISSALERKSTEALLNFTLQFENIITIISANFINISLKDINAEITASLRYVAEFLGVDQSYVFMANSTGRRFKLSHHWLDNQLQPDPAMVEMVESKKYVWVYRQIKKNGLVSIESTKSLPEEAGDLKKLFQKAGIKSMIGVPIMSKNVFRGLLVLASFKQERFWQEEAVPLLKILGQIIANALERKQQEEEIAETRELYRTLARNIPKAAVFLYDHELRYRLVEGAELENQGYDKDSMEGRVISQVLPPTSLKLLEPLYRDALKGKEHLMEREFNKKHYLINFLPVRNERDEIYAGMVMSLDITDLKETQRKLEQHTVELTRSNEDLELFAYAASHDLQEPLRMVSSYVHLIQRKLQTQLDADTQEFMNYAVDGVKRMQELINALLEYSRVDRKANNLRPINMNKTVEFVKINLQGPIAETGATIHTGNLPEIVGDQPQIISLLQNLLENAIKFHGTEKPVVHIGYKEEKDRYGFFVKDNGIGIDKKYFDRIFIIFQRLNSRSEYSGTGIGLAICKKIVERHGGRLWVESEPGKGTTFYFEIAKPQS